MLEVDEELAMRGAELPWLSEMGLFVEGWEDIWIEDADEEEDGRDEDAVFIGVSPSLTNPEPRTSPDNCIFAFTRAGRSAVDMVGSEARARARTV